MSDLATDAATLRIRARLAQHDEYLRRLSPGTPLEANSWDPSLREEFLLEARGTGRAGTADATDDPYMSMGDAADVYARIMTRRAGSGGASIEPS